MVGGNGKLSFLCKLAINIKKKGHWQNKQVS